MIRKLIYKMRKRRFCKLNRWSCPDCIYHDFVFEGAIFRGNKCRYPKYRERSEGRMKINRDLNIELSPREVAEEIWDMASDEQASLLNILAAIYQADYPNFCMQLEYVYGEFENDYGEAEQERVVRMLETMVEYFDRRGED